MSASPSQSPLGRKPSAEPARSAPVGFAEVLRVREFRWLWLASMQSLLGDQLARVALSVLVFRQTGSTLWTAVVYALTFLPALAGGLLLSGVADRYPRRNVLIGCDMCRAVLLAVMAVRGLPILAVGALLVLATLVGAPFKAAEPALIADIFSGDKYVTALGLRTATSQAAQLIGFAVGGVAVAALGPRPSLAVDAATFAVSAVVLRIGLAARPAAVISAGTQSPGGWAGVRQGVRLVATSPQLRVLLGLTWLVGLWIVPEGLAVPYAASVGGGPAAAGCLLAALPAGNVLGALVVSRWISAYWRRRLVGPLAVGCGVPLIACAAHPNLIVTIALWALAGVCCCYQVPAIAEYVGAVRNDRRGQAIGLAASGLLAAQGLGVVAAGFVAQHWAVAPAVAVAGATGSVLAAYLAIRRLGTVGFDRGGSITRPTAL
jgi:predicted MFS family arabinose efflux permease